MISATCTSRSSPATTSWDYAFMGTDPEAPDNIWLREAAERQIAFIYFLGVSRRPRPARAAAQ